MSFQFQGVTFATAEDLVNAIYTGVLRREPTVTEKNVWAGSIAGGTSPAVLFDTLAASEEVRKFVEPVIRVYEAAFGRQPDQAGLTFWVNVLRDGGSLKLITDGFVQSPEFQQRYNPDGGPLDRADAVNAFYRNVLGREPDALGLAFWTSADADLSLLLESFAISTEFDRRANDEILKFLRESASNNLPDPTKSLFEQDAPPPPTEPTGPTPPTTPTTPPGGDGGGPTPPPPPTYSIAVAPAAVTEGNAGIGATLTYTVTRTGDVSAAGTVAVALSGTAGVGDYTTSLTGGGVSFAAGVSTASFTVTTTPDTVVEANETVVATLGAITGGGAPGTAVATSTITNDDQYSFAITATDAVKAEGNTGTTAFTFTVTRSGTGTEASSVNWAVSSAFANAADFGGALPSGTLAFAAGDTTKTITVNVSGDFVKEADEAFTVTLSGASANAVIGTPSADGTITNNDEAVLLLASNRTPKDTYATIEAAYAAAAANDIIVLSAGSYTLTGANNTLEIAFAKPVTIEGPNKGVAASAARAPEAIIEGRLAILGDGTTIDGVRFAEGASGGSFDAGAIHVQAATVVVKNSVFERSGPVDGDGFRGVVTAIGAAPSLTIENNSFSGWATGVYLNPGATGATVSNNSFTNNFVGMSMDDPHTGTRVSGNTFNNAEENIGIGFSGTTATSIDLSAIITGTNSFSGTKAPVSVYDDGTARTITGTAFADVVNGADGNDTLTVAGGTLPTIAVVAGRWTVGSGPSADTLNDVEIVQAGAQKALLVGLGGFDTIQAAVNAAGDGDVIFVANGTYPEQVLIDNKPNLTITGQSEGGVIIRDPAGAISNNATWGGSSVFAIVAVNGGGNVKLQKLTVDGGARGWDVGGGEFVGVYLQNVAGHVEDVTITGVRDRGTIQGGPDDGVSGMQRGIGLVVNNDDGTQRTFSLLDSTIGDFQKNGTWFGNANLTVTGNEVTGVGATPVIGQNGFQIARSTGTIDGNTITAMAWTGWTGDPQPAWYSSGIIAYENENLIVTNNLITGAGTSGPAIGQARFAGIDWSDNSGGSISGNTIGTALYGVVAYGYPTAVLGVDSLSGLVIGANNYTNITMLGVGVNEVGSEADNGSVGQNVIGSNFADYLGGNLQATNDTFNGAAGNDTFLGRLGADSLTGGPGNDVFVFSGGTGAAGIPSATSLGVDRITDFNPTDDTLQFSEAVFGNLDGTGSVGALSSAQIVVVPNTATPTTGLVTSNGAFVIVGVNASAQTVALYYMSSAVLGGTSVDGAGTNAVKIADITLVGSGLSAADFVSIA